MLVYLDGNQNRRAKPKDVPNENYARELLELHTLGVHGGYSQRDVYEAGRVLTGWHVRDGFRRGTVYFEPADHDDGEKRVLGAVIPAGGGEADVDRLVDVVCRHPSTARHIATKLVRRFVADDPPTSLVDRVAAVFTETDGDIKALVRTILLSDEFRAATAVKFKPPFRYVASCLRAVGADTHARAPLIEYLNRMGWGVFQHPTPDGYPDETAAWMGSLLWRWNFAYAVAAGAAPSVEVNLNRLASALSAGAADGARSEGATASFLFAHAVGGRNIPPAGSVPGFARSPGSSRPTSASSRRRSTSTGGIRTSSKARPGGCSRGWSTPSPAGWPRSTPTSCRTVDG